MEEQAVAPPPISLRPVSEADNALLLEIYATTRAEEMALVPWTVEQQRAFVEMQFTAQQAEYRKLHPSARHDIIMANGRPVGRLYVARAKDGIEILDVTLLPPERNAGVGSYLIRQLMDEAASKGTPLRIYIESFNPSLRLFERLGFKPGERQGIYILLEWRSEATKSLPAE